MLLVLQGSPVEAGATVTVKKGRWRQKMCGLASHYLVKASSLQQESKKSMKPCPLVMWGTGYLFV